MGGVGDEGKASEAAGTDTGSFDATCAAAVGINSRAESERLDRTGMASGAFKYCPTRNEAIVASADCGGAAWTGAETAGTAALRTEVG